MANIYEEWLSCSEQWRGSTWAASLSNSKKLTKIGARRWMMKQQIYERYQCWDIVQEIVDMKLGDPETHMDHPDAPHIDVRCPTFFRH